MEEKNQTKISPGQSDSQSSDKESIFTLMEKADLFDPCCPLSLKSALWLDFFLNNGPEAFKEKWLLLPSEEKNHLGIIFLKCYLHQPLFIALSREEKGNRSWGPTTYEKKKGLLQVSFESGGEKALRIYYPLPHHRLWPDLLQVLSENFIPSPRTQQSLERELFLASASRLAHLRLRAETLQAFLSGSALQENPPPSSITPVPLINEPAENNIQDQKPAIKFLALNVEPALASGDAAISEKSVKPSHPVKKKKKAKPADDQMKLF
jgi:hypothetical protein